MEIRNYLLRLQSVMIFLFVLNRASGEWKLGPDWKAKLRSVLLKRSYPIQSHLQTQAALLKKLEQNHDSFLRQSLTRLTSHNQRDVSDVQPQKSNVELTNLRAQIEKQSTETNAKYRYNVALDNTGALKLFWDIQPTEERIDFHIEAAIDKTDMLGFGFSDYGQSETADVVMFWTDHHGRHMFQDCHTDEDGLLHVDNHQDYHLDDVKVTGTNKMTLTFHRLYDTCDNEDYLIDEGTTHMIFFTLQGPQKAIQDLNVTEVQPGLQRSQLLKSQLEDPQLPPDTFSFTAQVNNVEIPARETTYWCYVTELPLLVEKHHIIKYDGVISDNGLTHHLEVFHCEVPDDVTIRDFNEPCATMETRPPGLESCRKVIGAWAMGATGVTYPEEAGSPIGGPGYSRYVMLEVHYNNPNKLRGLRDSSGLRFHVTRTLRRYDVGIMELGQEYTDKPALPPGVPRWKLHGYCVSDCTSVGLNEGGIKVFASQLHTHQTGKTVYTKHYRNGVELPELNRDQHYSPHYQEIRKLKRQVNVMPGDVLITTCEDSTVDRQNVTLGGFSISDEMCVNYIHYYPKQELEVCKSSVTTSSLYDYFRFLNEYQGEDTSMDKGISQNYHSIHWTAINSLMLKTFFDIAPLSMQCNKSDGDRFPGEWEGQPVPQVLYPLPPPERPCLV